jgi:hypothetical protein
MGWLHGGLLHCGKNQNTVGVAVYQAAAGCREVQRGAGSRSWR